MNSFGGVSSLRRFRSIVVCPAATRASSSTSLELQLVPDYQHVTKWAEQVVLAESVPDAMRRAFTQVKNGRPRPVLVEIPVDIMREEVPDGWQYTPTPRLRVAPDPKSVTEVAAALVAAERPVIYAGQGVHYAKGWKQLRELAELLEAPGRRACRARAPSPANHPLSLVSGGRSISKPAAPLPEDADLVFGIGCSFAPPTTASRCRRATLLARHAGPARLNKDFPVELALVGDAALTWMRCCSRSVTG